MSDDELQLNQNNRYDDDDEEEFSYSTKNEQNKDEKVNKFVSK